MDQKYAPILIFASVFLAFSPGCGEDSDAPGPTGPSGSSGSAGAAGSFLDDAGNGALALTVTAAWEAEVGPVAPAAGQTHVVLDVGVVSGADSSHLVSPAVFRIAGSDGLERVASPLTDLLANGCPSDALLSPGASTQCQLVFVVPETLTIERLLYHDGLMSAEATVPPVAPCERCDGRCTDLASDPNHCGACDHAAPSNSACVNGKIECTEAGALACQNANGSLSCTVANTAEHCGACGNACDALPGGGAECRQGLCLYPAGGFFGDCNLICSQLGLACAFSEQCGANGDCNQTPASGCALTCYCRE